DRHGAVAEVSPAQRQQPHRVVDLGGGICGVLEDLEADADAAALVHQAIVEPVDDHAAMLARHQHEAELALWISHAAGPSLYEVAAPPGQPANRARAPPQYWISQTDET